MLPEKNQICAIGPQAVDERRRMRWIKGKESISEDDSIFRVIEAAQSRKVFRTK
jgi:hypothetical protein